jgi:hypothetical protein
VPEPEAAAPGRCGVCITVIPVIGPQVPAPAADDCVESATLCRARVARLFYGLSPVHATTAKPIKLLN